MTVKDFLSADGKDMKLIIILSVIIGIIAIAICTFFAWRWLAKRKGKCS